MQISEVTQQIIGELKQGERSAYEILIAINQTRSHGRVDVLALYRALAQLEQQGSIRNAGDREVPGSPQEYQRYYRLTETRQPAAQTKAEPDQPLKQQQALVATIPQPVNVHDGAHYQYDVFISVSEEDKEWAENVLIPKHIKYFINEHQFINEDEKREHFIQMYKISHTLLIVLSPSWKNEWENHVTTIFPHINTTFERIFLVMRKTCDIHALLHPHFKGQFFTDSTSDSEKIVDKFNNQLYTCIQNNRKLRSPSYKKFEAEDNIIDRYSILKIISYHTSSIIYLAEDTLFKKEVTIKQLNKTENRIDEQPDYENIFKTETEILQSLNNLSQNVEFPIRIPRIIDIFDTCLCYVMNYIPGESLKDILKKNPFKISVLNSVLYTRDICTITCYLHENSIAHGDIKVDNVILDDYNHIWLIDFGNAYKFQEVSNDQLTKLPSDDIADIAKLLYQLITGQPLYQPRNDKYSMSKKATELLNNTPYIPEEVKKLINDGIAPSAQRPDAKTFLDRLKRIIDTTLPTPDGSLIDTASMLAQWIKEHWQPRQQVVDGNMSAEIAEKWKNQALAENIQQRWADLTDNKERAIDAVLALVDQDNFGAQPQELECYLREPGNEQESHVGKLQAGQKAALQLEVDQPVSISNYTLVFSNLGERYVKSRVANWPFWIKILTEHTVIELAPRANARVEIPIMLHGARFHNWNIPEEYIDLHFDDPLHAEPRVARIRVLARAEHATTPKRWWNIWLALLGLLLVVAMGLYWFT